MTTNVPLKTLIIFNGPVGSGKDYIVNTYIQTFSTGVIVKFAQPIREAAISTFDHITSDNFEGKKSIPLFADEDITLRQWMIGFGETLMKPMFGNGIFGKLTAVNVNKMFGTSDIVFITDSGFVDEFNSLIENIDDNVKCVLIHLHREGHDFANDSRSYIDITDDNITIVELHNNGSIESSILTLNDIITDG